MIRYRIVCNKVSTGTHPEEKWDYYDVVFNDRQEADKFFMKIERFKIVLINRCYVKSDDIRRIIPIGADSNEQ